MPLHDDITDVPGFRVGHDTNEEAATGCTVILCDRPTTGGVDIRGGAPATRETDLLSPTCMVDMVNAIVLTGGSAFGLDAVSGVVRYLEEQQIGFETGVVRVPIVPAAAIFDLAIGSASIRPDAQSGYRACQNSQQGPIAQGNVGAGTGATVGKVLGIQGAMKGGSGSASAELAGGIIVGALVIVNALGDIIDPQTQHIIAGARHPLTTEQEQKPTFGNTTIGVIATNAALSKAECTKVAQMAHNGLAQVIRPAHTMFDGDAIFALASCERTATEHENTATAAQRVSMIGAIAASTMARAIVKAISQATDLHNIPAAK